MAQQFIFVLLAWGIAAAQAGHGSRFGGILNDDDTEDPFAIRSISSIELKSLGVNFESSSVESGPNIACSSMSDCPGVCPNLKFPTCNVTLGKCACQEGPTKPVYVGCASTPDGEHALNPADPTCRTYLKCVNQKIKKMKTCAGQGVFNAANQICGNKRRVHCPLRSDPDKCDQELDVAIVGAGPGGAYSAYSLRDSGKSIGMFEYSDRIGGRTYDYKLPNTPDIYLKLGAMRLIKGAHLRVERILEELNLTTQVFTEGEARAGRSRSFLRGQSVKKADLWSGSVPYFLNAEETQNQDRLLLYYLEKLTGFNESSLTREQLLDLKTPDGRHLYTLSFPEFLDLTASPDGKQFILDSYPFKSTTTEECSAIDVYHDYFGEDFEGTDIYEIDDGFQAMTKGLVNEFIRSGERNTLKMNQKLESIRGRADGSYLLTFRATDTFKGRTIERFSETSTVCAKQVILAIPVMALKVLDWQPLHSAHAHDVYNSVIVSPASKIFMTFDQAWWLNTNFTDSPAYAVQQDMLVSQIYDWKKSNESGVYILLVSYSDDARTDTLRKMQDIGKAMPGSAPGTNRVSTYLRNQVLKSLADVFGVDVATIPKPISGAAQFWTDYPYGGGWVTPRKGYHFGDMVENMRRPSLKDSVYVVGADYSWGMNSGWCEGAFETVEEVMHRYF